MRFRKAFLTRAASILLPATMLLCGVAFRGEARIVNLRAGSHSSLSLRAASPARSASGGRIAFASGGEIYLVAPDGSGLKQLTSSDPGVYNYQPALSPDGTRVAFSSAQSNKSGINVVAVDGTGLRRLTTNSLSYDSEPAWSPDGSKIAFVRGFDPTVGGIANFTSCGSEIYVVGMDDGREINLTQGLGGTDPAWSPDGKRIAFASSRENYLASNHVENYDIYSMTDEGGDVLQLTMTEENEAEPAWSPDGKRIAYARNYLRVNFSCGFAHTGFDVDPTLNGPDIYVMSSDGSDQNRLTHTENNLEPAWSPDGASLAFVSSRKGYQQIYVLHPHTKREFGITSDAAHKSSPSWAHTDDGPLNALE